MYFVLGPELKKPPEGGFLGELAGNGQTADDFTSQEPIRLRLYLAQNAIVNKPSNILLNVLDMESWNKFFKDFQLGFVAELNGELFPQSNNATIEAMKDYFSRSHGVMA